MLEPKFVGIDLKKGLVNFEVDRDKIVGAAKTVAQLAREVRNITDCLVVTDLDHNRRERRRMHERCAQLEELALELERLFP